MNVANLTEQALTGFNAIEAGFFQSSGKGLSASELSVKLPRRRMSRLLSVGNQVSLDVLNFDGEVGGRLSLS